MSALTPSNEVGLCMRYKATADVLDDAIGILWFTDDETRDRQIQHSRWKAKVDMCYSYGPRESWFLAREHVLFASALERNDRKALATQIRRLADRARAEAFAVADALEAT